MPQNLEVDAADIIRLILQFMKENNLKRSLQTLQEETNISLDYVENAEALISHIHNGRWDLVLSTISYIKLPENVLHVLYEHVICELIEMRESDLARHLIRDNNVLQSLKLKSPEKISKLEKSINKNVFDPKELYEGSTKEKKRTLIAKLISEHIESAPASRLVALIGMALKWQQHQGLLPAGEKIDLFLNTSCKSRNEKEKCPQQIAQTIYFGGKSHAECAIFSHDGQYLVSGSVDGFIEVWNWMTGALNLDLQYQKDDNMMMHSSAVLALAFSRDSEILATGSQDGQIKIWRIALGTCVRKLDKAHDAAITSIQFSRDSLQILTASFDQIARIHGLKTGKVLKEFRGHTSYVNAAIYTSDGTRVVTCGSDGRVKVFDAKTAECLHSFSPPPPPYQSAAYHSNITPAITTVFLAPKTMGELIFVCTKSSTIYVMNLTGQVMKVFSSGKQEGGDFVAACTSPRAEWVYCVGEDNTLYCFANASGKLEHVMNIHEKEAIGICHHPHHDVLASWGFDGALHLIKN